MDSGSRAAANLTAALLRLGPLNASSPPGRWDGGPPAGGTGLQEQQRLVREQAYRDFTTAIQVLILISSLLGKWMLCQINRLFTLAERPQKSHRILQRRHDLYCGKV